MGDETPSPLPPKLRVLSGGKYTEQDIARAMQEENKAYKRISREKLGRSQSHRAASSTPRENGMAAGTMDDSMALAHKQDMAQLYSQFTPMSVTSAIKSLEIKNMRSEKRSLAFMKHENESVNECKDRIIRLIDTANKNLEKYQESLGYEMKCDEPVVVDKQVKEITLDHPLQTIKKCLPTSSEEAASGLRRTVKQAQRVHEQKPADNTDDLLTDILNSQDSNMSTEFKPNIQGSPVSGKISNNIDAKCRLKKRNDRFEQLQPIKRRINFMLTVEKDEVKSSTSNISDTVQKQKIIESSIDTEVTSIIDKGDECNNNLYKKQSGSLHSYQEQKKKTKFASSLYKKSQDHQSPRSTPDTRASKSWTRATKVVKVECPLCAREFPQNKIEVHAATCDGQVDSTEDDDRSLFQRACERLTRRHRPKRRPFN